MFGWTPEQIAKAVELIGPAVAYDIESLPNIFTCNAESIAVDDNYTFEISARRNDTLPLVQWLNALRAQNVPMIGYNNVGYDYVVIHFIIQNVAVLATMSGADAAAMIKQKSDQVIKGDRFANSVWLDQRHVPQIDLFKIHHFDNKAKSQSLKGLEFNMRSTSVKEGELPFDQAASFEDIDRLLIPYNAWDTKETKRFALISAEAIAFRRDMIANGMISGDVLNFNDTKLGKELLIQRLGDQLCFTWTPRKAPRQTIRTRVAMSDVVFPYITFEHPELNRVLNWIKAQTLTASDLEEVGKTESVSTKGVFTGLNATIDGFTFVFGTGGIHGSVKERYFAADDEYHIEDIDVASLYPSVAIVNRLYPEHLGERFIEEYSGLKAERFKYAKNTVQNGALKLALNGSYGDSGSEFSPLFDKQFLLKITINGQLQLCMLAEQLMKVPTLEMIQINTDGMTYRVHRQYKDHCAAIHKWWEAGTLLDLEKAYYSRMWVRDVNSYVAESAKDGKLKLKGAYWYHDGLAFPSGWTEAVSKAGPSAWHKDLGAQAVQRAAVAAMVYGVDPYHWLICHRDPFDFMLRGKADKGAKLFIDDQQVQKITRYYITNQGGRLHKVAMPTGPIGQFKPKPKVDKAGYAAWHAAWGNVWNPEFHTANRSQYEMVDTALQAGYQVTECNIADQFSFANVNYGWYLDAARKLIIK